MPSSRRASAAIMSVRTDRALACPGDVAASTLNRLPIWSLIRKPRHLPLAAWRVTLQSARSASVLECAAPAPWRAGRHAASWRASTARAALAQRLASASKSTCEVRSHSPGLSMTVSEAMPAHGLQRIARRARQMAIVDDEGGARMARQPLADVRGRSASRAGASSTTSPSRPSGPGDAGPRARGRGCRLSSPITRSCQRPSPPLELADGDRIEELVGDQDHRALGHLLQRSCASWRLGPSAWRCLARSTGLVSTRWSDGRGGKAGRHLARWCAACRPSACRGRGPVRRD